MSRSGGLDKTGLRRRTRQVCGSASGGMARGNRGANEQTLPRQLDRLVKQSEDLETVRALLSRVASDSLTIV